MHERTPRKNFHPEGGEVVTFAMTLGESLLLQDPYLGPLGGGGKPEKKGELEH